MYSVEVYDRDGYFCGHFGIAGLHKPRNMLDCVSLPLWNDQSEALYHVACQPMEWLARHTIRTTRRDSDEGDV